MNKIYETAVCCTRRRRRYALSALKSEKGQTLIEYALLLVLIAVVVVLMVKGVGITANNTYSLINSSVTEAVK